MSKTTSEELNRDKLANKVVTAKRMYHFTEIGVSVEAEDSQEAATLLAKKLKKDSND